MTAKLQKRFSVKDYLNVDKENDTKYEYRNGNIVSLSGRTLAHTEICNNIVYQLISNLKQKNVKSKAYNSELKIYIPEAKSFVYPDASIITGAIITDEENDQAATNPEIIVEVLSANTASYDRGRKFELYRQIKTLKEYILIEQDLASIDVFKKVRDLWSIKTFSGLKNNLTIDSLAITVALKEIYKDVNLINEVEEEEKSAR